MTRAIVSHGGRFCEENRNFSWEQVESYTSGYWSQLDFYLKGHQVYTISSNDVAYFKGKILCIS